MEEGREKKRRGRQGGRRGSHHALLRRERAGRVAEDEKRAAVLFRAELRRCGLGLGAGPGSWTLPSGGGLCRTLVGGWGRRLCASLPEHSRTSRPAAVGVTRALREARTVRGGVGARKDEVCVSLRLLPQTELSSLGCNLVSAFLLPGALVKRPPLPLEGPEGTPVIYTAASDQEEIGRPAAFSEASLGSPDPFLAPRSYSRWCR